MTTSTRRGFLRSGLAAGTAAAVGVSLAGCRTARGGSAQRPSQGEDPDQAPTDAERAAFLAAVVAGRVEDVRALLARQRTLVDATDAAGCSAVVLACREQHAEVVTALLEHEPRLELVEAVMLGDWERATELARADPARMDAWHPVGGSAIYAAARAGETGFYRLQFLGADPDANPKGPRVGVTPAYGALLCKRPSDALSAVTNLLSNGAHVNAPQAGGDTLLHVATRRGDVEIVKYLLRRGADVHVLDRRGRSALSHAEREGHEAVTDLLRHPQRVPRDDMTLRYAYDASGAPVQWPELSDVPFDVQGQVTGRSHNDLDAVRELVGDDPRRSFSRSSQNELAVEACGHTGFRDAIRFHLDRGVPQSLATSLSVGDLDRARALLTDHPNGIHERGPHDFAVMWYAAIGGGSVEAADLLLEFGADVDQSSQGTTAMHQAARRGHRDLVAFLAERGARLDAVGYNFDREGRTPLQLALERGKDDVARLLRELGAA